MDYKSNFSFSKVYFILITVAFLSFGMGYLIMFKFQPRPGLSIIWMYVFGIAVISFGTYIIYTYVKLLPVIRIDYSGITLQWLLVRRQKFAWSEVVSVKYTGKTSFRLGFNLPMEVMVIQLKDQREIKIFYEHYTKGYVIQRYVKSYHEYQRPPAFSEDKNVSSDELIGESFTAYKGNPFLSLRGVAIWSFLLFLIIITIKNGLTTNSIVIAFLCYLPWYFLNAYYCFYIKVSDNYLVVKNYFIPFIGKKYWLSDIQEIAMEIYPRWPDSLRVITTSFRYKVFPCGLIRDKDWRSFKRMIREKGIKVRTEAVPLLQHR